MSSKKFFSTRKLEFNSYFFFTRITTLSILVLTLFAPNAHSLSLGPIELDKPSGQLRLINTTKSFRKIKMTVYPAEITKIEGATLKTSDFNVEEVNSLVRINPRTVRLSGGGIRYVDYSIKDKTGNYYICAEGKMNGLFQIRICSLYAGGI